MTSGIEPREQTRFVVGQLGVCDADVGESELERPGTNIVCERRQIGPVVRYFPHRRAKP